MCFAATNCAVRIIFVAGAFSIVEANTADGERAVTGTNACSSALTPSSSKQPSLPSLITLLKRHVTLTAEGARSLKCISKCETSLHFFHLSGCTLQHHHQLKNPRFVCTYPNFVFDCVTRSGVLLSRAFLIICLIFPSHGRVWLCKPSLCQSRVVRRRRRIFDKISNLQTYEKHEMHESCCRENYQII